jgi:DNA polymerase III gamma/tau subunit
MLGTANDQLLFRLLENMMQGEQMKIFTELESAASQGVDFGILVEQMMGLYRDLLVTASGGDAHLLLCCSPQQFDQVKKLATELGLHRILAAMQILDHTHTRMQRSTQGRVLMELALVRIANLDHFHQVAVLLEQLRSGNATPSVHTVKPVQKTIAPPQSPRIANVELGTLNDEQAKSIWLNAAESIPGTLGSMAMTSKSIRFESPNIFVAVFDNKPSKDFCEKESARLQGVLSQSVGEAGKIRWELDAGETATVAQPSSHQADREQYLAASEHPLVQKIQEAFGVTMHEVRR